MDKIKIYLADLTHVNSSVVSENIPLNIGLLKSYTLKVFGGKVDISLYKYPEDLLKAMRGKKPHILGCSNYIWNSKLSEWAFAEAKKIDKNILTVKGGWNFPLDAFERTKYLTANRHTDIYCINESEKSFVNIVKIFMESGRSGVLSGALPGCAYLDRKSGNPVLVTGENPERITNLDEVPSPYTTGVLDEFFDGKLTPVIETTRGCPFQCNYCNSAVEEYFKVTSFSDEYVLRELNYIGAKVGKNGAGPLIIADVNFGMYKRDHIIADKISQLRDKYNWPNSVLLTTGKKNIEGVLNTVKSLRDLLVPSMSVQSMNRATLDEIKRTNLTMNDYKEYAAYAEKEGITIYAELILSLPKETLETYWNGLIDLLASGARKVITYTLQMNYGTLYRLKDYTEEHGYEGKYRLIPNAFGIYDGNMIFDMEMVAVSNKYLSFADYLECRKIAFLVELSYNNYCFSELVKFYEEKGFSIRDYLNSIRDNFSNAPKSLIDVTDAFIGETKSELFDSEEDLIKFYSKPVNFQKLAKGEAGRNVIYSNKETVYGKYAKELISYVINSARKFFKEKSSLSGEENIILNNIEKYTVGKFYGFLKKDTIENNINIECEYDIFKWHQSVNKPASFFKKKTKYEFCYSDEQKVKIYEMFNVYGDSISGKTKIIAKTMLLQNLLRRACKKRRKYYEGFRNNLLRP